MRLRVLHLAAVLLSVAACSPGWAAAGPRADLHVAAASDLVLTLQELGNTFERSNHVRIIGTFGPTAQLAQQIENGAPYDVFLAADVTHVDALVSKGIAVADTNFVFARGQLAVFAPLHPEISNLAGLQSAAIRTIALANPDLAPYGAAARQSLERAGLWKSLSSRVVYAPSVSMAKQFADTGNADAAFVALSLLPGGTSGHYFAIPPAFYDPIAESACVIARSPQRPNASAFLRFLAGNEARIILRRHGFKI